MIPYRDSLRARSTPWVNWTLIAINVLVFFYQKSLATQAVVIGDERLTGEDQWIYEWGTVACRLADSCPAGFEAVLSDPPNAWLTLLSATFIHAGILHLAGNMLFLFIFGDNVEDAMGHVPYLIFYLLCGVIAGLAQFATGPDSVIPAVGASGAIAGVMAAYLVLYPRATVSVLIPLIVIPWLTNLPAFVLMIFWFGIQIVSGVAELGARATGGEGGVAWFAHVGGFLAGLALVWFFRTGRRSHDVRFYYDRFGWG